MFLFSGILCLVGYGRWNCVPLSAKTIAIIVIGCASFCFGSSAAYSGGGIKQISFRKDHHDAIIREYHYSVELWKILALFVLMMLVFYVRVTSMKRIAGEANVSFDSFRKLVRWYRNTYSSLFGAGTVRVGVGETLIEKQILKFSSVISNVSVVLILLTFSTGQKKQLFFSILLFVTMVTYVLITSGGRGDLLFKLFSLVYGAYIIAYKKGMKVYQLNRVFLTTGVILLLVMLPVFFYSSALVGRKTDSNMIDYISFYWGCGIPSLELKLQSGIAEHAFGQNVFYGIHTLLYKLKITDQLEGYANDWAAFGVFRSNVYTAWYRYYADFGMIGVVFFSSVYGYAATWLHQKAKYSDSLFILCILCTWSYSIFDLNRDDYLFGQFLGTNPIIVLVLILITAWWIFRPNRPLICSSAGEMTASNDGAGR